MKRSRTVAGSSGLALAGAVVTVAGVAAVLLVAAVMGSCIDDGTMLCSSGLRCPVDHTCTQDGTACTNTPCGNGIVDPGEVCDDGNLRPGDSCIGCISNGECGNGIVDLGEQCDPAMTSGRPCDSQCRFSCGNQQLDAEEECDQSVFRVSCVDLGFDRGSASCDATLCVARGAACAHIGWHRDLRTADGTNTAVIGDLHGVWGAANGQIYAVGTSASGGVVMILHFDGQRWQIDVQGPSRGTLLDIWGSSSDDAFAVGDGGRALYLNASGTWLPLNTRVGPDVTLRGVWGDGPAGDVLAVGDAATIIRFARIGGAWSKEQLRNVPANTVFEAVWGRDGNEVYAVGHDGVIMRYSQFEWVREAAGLTSADLFDVWGSGEAVYAVGEGGTILRRYQNAWTIMDTPHQGNLRALWGSSEKSVYAAGERGLTLFYDGKAWRELASDTDSSVTDMWGVPGYGLVGTAPNGFLLRLDGWGWMPLPESSDSMRSLWVHRLDDIFGVFDEPPYLRHFDGSAWSGVDIDGLLPPDHGPSPLAGLWGTPSREIYAVGDGGLVLRLGPAGWERMEIPDTLPASNLVHAWRSSGGYLFVVGALADQTDGIILRHDGVSWQQMSKNRQTILRGVWGVSRGQVYAVGTGGAILYYDGNAAGEFRVVNTGTQLDLNAIWGNDSENIHVVGDSGVALAFNGSAWSRSTDLTTEHLYGVWGSGTDHVFAVGSSGALLHRVDRKWSVVRSGTDQRLTAIGGVNGAAGRNRVVVFGGEGASFRRLLVADIALTGP